MKVTLNWLKEYVPIEMGAEEVADALTMIGLEVESLVDRFEYLKTVKVGKVLHVEPHPGADRLNICTVDVGGEHLKIICGAPNVQKEKFFPVAIPGTTFPDGKTLEKTMIRGVISEGMICSEKELGLGFDQSGVMVLTHQSKTGEDLAGVLGLSDTILEISVTPNRPDCLSVLGIAREIAGIQGEKLSYPKSIVHENENRLSKITSVRIEAPELCPRYAARLLYDVQVAPSPFWLQDRLISIGVRPINNIVDITNYVLMETGQPLHAFDFDRLDENRIVVRTAKAGEIFTTLDGKQRNLPPDALMICDGQKPVAIGGIMGGMNSEISDATRRVFIESAYFSPAGIRRTAKTLGLSTEASYRFERGIDPEGTISALNRAAGLMMDISGGKLIEGIIDENPEPIPRKRLSLSITKTKELLGFDCGSAQVKKLLSSIEFEVEKQDKDHLNVTAPSFRVDVQRPEDLMEEVARLSGYDQIPITYPTIHAGLRTPNRIVEIRNRIKDILVGLGFAEVINYSFIHKTSPDRMRIPEGDSRRKGVPVLNPLSEDQSTMRTSLIPGLLETLHRNIAQQIKTLRVFEIGKIFIAGEKDELPVEIEMLSLLWTGLRFSPSWYGKETPCDFYDLKGTVESLFEALRIQGSEFFRAPGETCHYTRAGQTGSIRINGRMIGLIGEIDSEVKDRFDIKQSVFIAELNLDELFPYIPETRRSVPISRYPSVTRDVTIIVDKKIEAWEILKFINNSRIELIETVQLVDVFDQAPIPAGKKSISFRIIYHSMDKTLEDTEVNRIHHEVSMLLLNFFKASLPE
ncbi:MAG: phenylalanine--tRNA ligase subunit beta [Thermodesulfobacteriota bacterium]